MARMGTRVNNSTESLYPWIQRQVRPRIVTNEGRSRKYLSYHYGGPRSRYDYSKGHMPRGEMELYLSHPLERSSNHS